MPNKGFDSANPLTPSLAALFVSQGYSFVGRYLAPECSWKRLTVDEARIINEAGLYIVSFFERYQDRAREGAPAGAEDGETTFQLAKEVGQPEGTTIYLPADYNAGPEDFDAIEAYMRAADQQMPGYELGVYGSYSVCKAMYERGVTKKLMQTIAWSYGKRYENACIFQSEIDKPENGINVDLDVSNGDAGGWNMLKPQQGVPQLPAAIANNIIDSYLDATWKNCEAQRLQAEKDGRTADEQSWLQLRDWQHILANQLRISSGQPEQ